MSVPVTPLDLVYAQRCVVLRVLFRGGGESGRGSASPWKVLVLDEWGRRVISSSTPLWLLRRAGVTLPLSLSSAREAIPDADAVYVWSPEGAGVLERVAEDLRRALYRRCWLLATHALPRAGLERLARRGAAEGWAAQVEQVLEAPLEAWASGADAFSLGHEGWFSAVRGGSDTAASEAVGRAVRGLASVCASLGLGSAVVACPSGATSPAGLVGRELASLLAREGVSGAAPAPFASGHLGGISGGAGGGVDAGQSHRALVVVVDRDVDLSGALVAPACLMALVEDALGCDASGRVRAAPAPDPDEAEVPAALWSGGGGVDGGEGKQITLDAEEDVFWRTARALAMPRAIELHGKALAATDARARALRAAGASADVDSSALGSAVAELPRVLARKTRLEAHTELLSATMGRIAARRLPRIIDVGRRVVRGGADGALARDDVIAVVAGLGEDWRGGGGVGGGGGEEVDRRPAGSLSDRVRLAAAWLASEEGVRRSRARPGIGEGEDAWWGRFRPHLPDGWRSACSDPEAQLLDAALCVGARRIAIPAARAARGPFQTATLAPPAALCPRGSISSAPGVSSAPGASSAPAAAPLAAGCVCASEEELVAARSVLTGLLRARSMRAHTSGSLEAAMATAASSSSSSHSSTSSTSTTSEDWLGRLTAGAAGLTRSAATVLAHAQAHVQRAMASGAEPGPVAHLVAALAGDTQLLTRDVRRSLAGSFLYVDGGRTVSAADFFDAACAAALDSAAPAAPSGFQRVVVFVAGGVSWDEWAELRLWARGPAAIAADEAEAAAVHTAPAHDAELDSAAAPPKSADPALARARLPPPTPTPPGARALLVGGTTFLAADDFAREIARLK